MLKGLEEKVDAMLGQLDNFGRVGNYKKESSEDASAGCTTAHTCNPNYSGGRDQENRSSKPAQANSS
jgi:hypothetical protein